jgi:HEAT repeat protein
MTSIVRRLTAAAAVLCSLAAGPSSAAAQVSPPPGLGRGQQPSLLEQMRSESRTAIAVAVAAGRPSEALDTYDRFYTSVKRHDFTLLVPAVKGTLAAIAADPASLARIAALERLARSGDSAARGELEAAAGGGNTLMPAGIEADCALARLGDSPAIDRLIQRLGAEAPRDKGSIIKGLMDAGAKRAAYAIVPFLADENPSNRLAAIQALTKLGSREQIAPLRAAFEAEPRPFMRQSLAAALHSAGSDAGDAVLAKLETSPLPDSRLLAAEAYYTSKSPRWTAIARGLLRAPGDGASLRAAVMLGPSDPDAQRVLTAAAKSANMATREVGAMLLESAGSRDTTFLVTLLRDPSAFVRAYAGGALLAASR